MIKMFIGTRKLTRTINKLKTGNSPHQYISEEKEWGYISKNYVGNYDEVGIVIALKKI